MVIYSGSLIQNTNNTNNRRFQIWKKQCIFELINHQPDIDQKYLYAKDPYEAKYQFLINKREWTGLKQFDEILLGIQMIYKMFIKILMNAV